MSSDADSNEPYSPWPQDWLVTHVPADVWREIFKIHLAEETLASSNRHGTRLGPHALPLCEICSRWREIVIHAPELWNTVSLYIYNTGRVWPHPKLLDLVLKRSGNVPLRISFGGDIERRRKFAGIRNAVRLLFPNFHRAEDIDINTDVFNVTLPKLLDTSALEDILPSGAPFLRNLVIRMGSLKSPADHRISRILTQAPNLRSLVLDEHSTFDYSYLANILRVPFRQLTRVNIAAPILAQELCDFLSSNPNLVECIVGGLYWRYDFTPKPVFLPVLQHLSIRTRSDICLPFLAYINTPALETLNMEDCGDDDWLHADFVGFVENSSCFIQDFGLNILKSNTEEKLDSLRFLSQLRTLTLRVDREYESDLGIQNFKTNLIQELAKWDKSRKEFLLLPQLQKITIDYDVLVDPTHSTLFANMVEDRQIAVKVMNAERAEHHAQYPHELLRLLILKSRGFDVELEPQPEIEAEVFYSRSPYLW